MVSIELLLSVFGLALLDTVNPSALLVTMHLLPKSSATSRVLAYLAGVFTTYPAAVPNRSSRPPGEVRSPTPSSM